MTSLDINKVAIIGAGPSGICAARHFYHNKYNNKKFEIVVFEKQDQVGGLWIYNQWNKDVKKEDISPMHKKLISNIPYDAMYYPDFPFPKDTPMFPPHTVMLEYIQSYAKHFDVEKLIRFNTEVTLVSPSTTQTDLNEKTSENGCVKWNVESRNVNTGASSSDVFDAVIMCNGLYWKPCIPNIEGIDNFNGPILHSKYYDDDIDCLNKTVFIYGYGPSAIDIIKSKYDSCTQFYISIRSVPRFHGNHPSNVSVVADIKKVNDDGEIELTDGSMIKADIFFMCTGYVSSFPLSNEIEIGNTKKQRLWSFYKHVFHPKYPSLAVLGVSDFTPTFSYFHHVSYAIVAVFADVYTLPSVENMLNQVKVALGDAENKEKKFNLFEILKYFAEVSGEKLSDSIVESFIKTVEFASLDWYTYKEKYLQYMQYDSEEAKV